MTRCVPSSVSPHPSPWYRNVRFGANVSAVVDEADLRLVGELNELVVPDDDAFAEVLLRQIAFLEHFAGVQPHLANRRRAVIAGALVEESIDPLQALRERGGVVRIGTNDGVGEHGQRRAGRLRRDEPGGAIRTNHRQQKHQAELVEHILIIAGRQDYA